MNKAIKDIIELASKLDYDQLSELYLELAVVRADKYEGYVNNSHNKYLKNREARKRLKDKFTEETLPVLKTFVTNYVSPKDILGFKGTKSLKEVVKVEGDRVICVCVYFRRNREEPIYTGYGSTNIVETLNYYKGPHGVLKSVKEIVNFVKEKENATVINKESVQGESICAG